MDEPILTLWQEWQTAFTTSTEWGARWGALESALVRAIGFPRVLIPVSPATREVWATSHEQIDHELGDMPDADELRQRLHSDLTALLMKWDAVAASMGLDTADRREEGAWRKCEKIADALFALPARGIPGVIAKLELVLRLGETRVGDEEFPWGQLRSAVADLRRLAIGNDAPQTEAARQSMG
jgi:hypothetical protein